MLHRNALRHGDVIRSAPTKPQVTDPEPTMPIAKTTERPMLKSFDDVQKMNQANLDNAMKVWGDFAKGWQTIAAEMSDYAKRSFEDGTQTFEKLLAAKSPEQAFEIQSGYAKRQAEDYFREMSKLGALYSDLAKDAVKPFEVAMKKAR
jgi:hypothetical protein